MWFIKHSMMYYRANGLILVKINYIDLDPKQLFLQFIWDTEACAYSQRPNV